jgi:hypothetical protein
MEIVEGMSIGEGYIRGASLFTILRGKESAPNGRSLGLEFFSMRLWYASDTTFGAALGELGISIYCPEKLNCMPRSSIVPPFLSLIVPTKKWQPYEKTEQFQYRIM